MGEIRNRMVSPVVTAEMPEEPQAERAPVYMTNLQTALLFNPWRDKISQMDGKTLYADDGNPAMGTDVNLEKRERVRSHPAICDALSRLTTLYDREEEDQIPKSEYIRNYLKIFAVLQPDVPTQEARTEAEEDWLSDNELERESSETISEETLANSLFELSDLWCKSTDVNEYLSFLD